MKKFILRLFCFFGSHEYEFVSGSLTKFGKPCPDGDPCIDARLEWDVKCATCKKTRHVSYDTQGS